MEVPLRPTGADGSIIIIQERGPKRKPFCTQAGALKRKNGPRQGAGARKGNCCKTGYRSISSELVSLKKISREATIVTVRIVDSAAAVP